MIPINRQSKKSNQVVSALQERNDFVMREVENALLPAKRKELVFPEFDDIKVSTKTFIIMTNLLIDLKKLFEFLPVTDYTFVPKKRGRKKKNNFVNPNKNVPQGSIVTMKFENKIRGIDLKQKKSHTKKKKSKWFRNSFTVVIIMDDKPINLKVCRNGRCQVTGVKYNKQVEECLKYIWSHIKGEVGNIFTYSSGDFLEALFIPAMRNIDFSAGFLIDREKLARYMTTQTEFHSLLETSFGYTGVNIKSPIDKDIKTMVLNKLSFQGDDIIESTITYGDYLKLLPEKEQQKKLLKDRYTTFLVFQSGRIISSGISSMFMRDAYYDFINVIKTSYDQIEERLDL
jgi:TATA-box binding protein (TBP) (component of TFIID and TFIIIB)